jgi:4-hydroxybenzoate polyprenyltransferase
MKNLRGLGLLLLGLGIYFLLAYPPNAPEYGALMVMVAIGLAIAFGQAWLILAIPMAIAGYFYPYLKEWVWPTVGVIILLFITRNLWGLALWTGLRRLIKGKPRYGRRWDDNPHGPQYDRHPLPPQNPNRRRNR